MHRIIEVGGGGKRFAILCLPQKAGVDTKKWHQISASSRLAQAGKHLLDQRATPI